MLHLSSFVLKKTICRGVYISVLWRILRELWISINFTSAHFLKKKKICDLNGNLFPSILWMLGIMVLHVLLLFSWLYTQTHTEPWGIDDAEEKQQPTDMSGLATSSHRFCIIGVRLRFPYCLMCEQQPEATRTMCRVCLCVCVCGYCT